MLSFLNKQLSSDERTDELDEGNNAGSPLSGYLWKMKRKQTIIPRWDKRWFSIEGKFLRWYGATMPRKFSGEIDLSVVDGINSFQTAVGAFSFMVTFPQIHAEKNVLVLRAVSYLEMRRWLNILRMQADLARGGTGMGMIYGPSYTEDQFTGKGKSVKRKKKCGEASLEAELNITLSKLDKLELELKKEKKRADIAAATNGQIVGSVSSPDSSRWNSNTDKSPGDRSSDDHYSSEYVGYHNSPYKKKGPSRPSPANIADLDLVPRFPSKYAPRGGSVSRPRSGSAEANPVATTTITTTPQISPMKSAVQATTNVEEKRRDSEFVIEDMESDDAGWSPTFALDRKRNKPNGPISTAFADSKHGEFARSSNNSGRDDSNNTNSNSGAKQDSKSSSDVGVAIIRRRRDLDYPSDDSDSEDSGAEYEDGPDVHVSIVSRAQRRNMKHSPAGGAQSTGKNAVVVSPPEISVLKRSFDSGIHMTEVSVAIESTPNSSKSKQMQPSPDCIRPELALTPTKSQGQEKEPIIRAAAPLSITPTSAEPARTTATPTPTPMFHRHRKFKVVNGPNDKTPTAATTTTDAAAAAEVSRMMHVSISGPVPPPSRRSSVQEDSKKLDDAWAAASNYELGHRRDAAASASASDAMLASASVKIVANVTPVIVRRPSGTSERLPRRGDLFEESSSSDEDPDGFDSIIPGEKKDSFSSAARRQKDENRL